MLSDGLAAPFTRLDSVQFQRVMDALHREGVVMHQEGGRLAADVPEGADLAGVEWAVHHYQGVLLNLLAWPPAGELPS